MLDRVSHVVIFTMWYYPSHFGMHVDDIRDDLEKMGLSTIIVTVDPETFRHVYFDPVRHMFLSDWKDREGTCRLGVSEFIDRGSFSPLLFFDTTDPRFRRLSLTIASCPCIFFHFFEPFIHEFNRVRFPNATRSSLFYAGNFVSRILAGYGLPATLGSIDFCLDANLAHLYTGSPTAPRLTGVDLIVSETQSLVNMIGSSHLGTPAYQIDRPFDVQGVLATPPRNIRTSLGLSRDTTILVYAGRPSKNAQILPAVLRDIRELAADSFDVHLVLIGTQRYDISSWTWYREQQDHIHTIDFLARGELYGYLKTCDVLVYPGVVDGHPKIVSESQAAGLTVVAFDALAAGTNELIEDNRTGVLIPEGDIKAFARAVYTLLRNADDRARLSAEALRTIMQAQSAAGFARRYLNLCEQTPIPLIQAE